MAELIHFIPFPIMWPWGGTTGTLAFFSGVTWTDQNGMVHLEGKGLALLSDAAQLVTMDIADRVATPRAFDVEPTVSSIDEPRARITAVLFDENDRQKKVLFKNWEWPATPNPMTWPDLTGHNHTRRRCLGDRYLNETQIRDLIDGIPLSNPISTFGVANMVGGIVTVNTELVVGSSRALMTGQGEGVSGALRAENYVLGVGFDIVSSNGLDEGEVVWLLLQL